MYDLAVIGLGPAGLEAVSVALKNDLKVIAFEKEELGGTCLNVGCIPTKAILHVSNLFHEMKNASKLGISMFSAPDYNWQTILDRKTEIVNRFTKVLNSSLAKKITLVKSEAEINIGDNDIEIYANDNIYLAKNVIIATGSKLREIKGMEFDGQFIVSSDDVLKMAKLPRRIAIVGSGAIGLEWAKIFSDFNCEVKLVEKESVLSPLLDIELQKRTERLLKQYGVEYFKNDYIAQISNDLVILNSQTAFETDCILVAVGREPILPKITVSGVNQDVNIKFDENGLTDFENVFVVGDATGSCMLAHNASYRAKTIVEKIVFNKEIPKKQVPSVIYTVPEIASIGLREQDVQGLDEYRIKKILIPSIAKSWCDDCADGLIKLVLFGDKIVGAHVIAKEACSLVSMFSILIDKQISIYEIQDMIFPHPSYSEAILEMLKDE